MNLYLDVDDILPEFHKLESRQITFEHLTDEAKKIAAKFGKCYLIISPYIGPYVEIVAPRSALFDEETMNYEPRSYLY